MVSFSSPTIDPTRVTAKSVLAAAARVDRSLDALVGGNDAQARAWLHAENAHLGGVPAERIRSEEGLVDVICNLDAMRWRL